MKLLTKFFQENQIKYDENVDLKKKTWIHRGGVAKLFLEPANVKELSDCVSFLYKEKQPFLLIGHTSNLYIHNDADIDVVVSTKHCNSFTIQDNIIECECGAAVSKVAKTCIEHGLQGMEYLTSLPGTVGAAICNNSTVKESKVAELLVDLDFIDDKSQLKVLKPSDLRFSFRNSALKDQTLKGTILKVRLRLAKGDSNQLKEIAKQNEENRKLILEGPSKNLGCTVNRTFSTGEMPRKYQILMKIYGRLLSLFVPKEKRKAKMKDFILCISGYKALSKYISDKQMITFVWRDEKADELFPKYLEFMSHIYKTDSIEIQEIKKN